MSHSKRSPGPWRALHGSIVVDAGGDQVSELMGDDRCADARLIAAAPELLEALRALCDQGERYSPCGEACNLNPCARVRARAIIARIDSE